MMGWWGVAAGLVALGLVGVWVWLAYAWACLDVEEDRRAYLKEIATHD